MNRLLYNVSRALDWAQYWRDRADGPQSERPVPATWKEINNNVVAPLIEAKQTIARGQANAIELGAALLAVADEQLWTEGLANLLRSARLELGKLPPELLHEGPAAEADALLGDALGEAVERISLLGGDPRPAHAKGGE